MDLEDARGEVKVQQRKNASNLKDLTKQLQQYRKSVHTHTLTHTHTVCMHTDSNCLIMQTSSPSSSHSHPHRTTLHRRVEQMERGAVSTTSKALLPSSRPVAHSSRAQPNVDRSSTFTATVATQDGGEVSTGDEVMVRGFYSLL